MTDSDTHASDAFDGIELADAIESVREQLTEAAARASGHALVFELGDIQMEFTVELRREVKGGLKVRAWVVDAGADAARNTGRTHKVAFTLKPHSAADGSAWRVGNDRPGGGFGTGPR
ncbi:trypco2 family protein [Streptomyces sp. MBT27]|uniref:trypco2 family protein n=1 Tax=Streptomyces sp. MBT27 TaxID=1488356 RepID=UPI0014217B68|nr:trypco2 family protein [Streptomyces sp. MBT27]